MAMEWSLGLSQDGSFREDLACRHMTATCGYLATDAAASPQARPAAAGSRPAAGSSSSSSSFPSGGSSLGSPRFSAAGVCWSCDDGGAPRQLQLDDHEAVLLATWVRTGIWVLPAVAVHLEFAAAEAPPPAAAAAAPAGATVAAAEEAADAAAAAAAAAAGAAELESGASWGPTMWVDVRLKGGGQVVARVEVCADSWRPVSMRLQLAGDAELWAFSDCRQWQPGMWLAGVAVQTTSGDSSGMRNEYRVQSVQLRQAASTPGSSSSSSRFAQPPAPLLPPDTAFLPGEPEQVPAWHTTSGHRCASYCLPSCRVNCCPWQGRQLRHWHQRLAGAWFP